MIAPSKEEVIKAACDGFNKSTPKLLDEWTRLEGAVPMQGGFQYNYTLIGISGREVRTGFPRPLDDRTPTSISSMASYEDVCESLFSAATEKGLGLNTKVVAIADGAIGLREGLDVVFSDMLFVLAKYHFKTHAYNVAAA
ncbi:MAG: hypothetical protein GY822_07100, partial [Deltaproteobacteria bacterium]|nr:hypothetical protein [Deltaproteobacteria bacterium]